MMGRMRPFDRRTLAAAAALALGSACVFASPQKAQSKKRPPVHSYVLTIDGKRYPVTSPVPLPVERLRQMEEAERNLKVARAELNRALVNAQQNYIQRLRLQQETRRIQEETRSLQEKMDRLNAKPNPR